MLEVSLFSRNYTLLYIENLRGWTLSLSDAWRSVQLSPPKLIYGVRGSPRPCLLLELDHYRQYISALSAKETHYVILIIAHYKLQIIVDDLMCWSRIYICEVTKAPLALDFFFLCCEETSTIPCFYTIVTRIAVHGHTVQVPFPRKSF